MNKAGQMGDGSWGLRNRVMEPRRRRPTAHSRALPKQMLSHGQAELRWQPTPLRGLQFSSPGLYYSYTGRPTSPKIPQSTGCCLWRQLRTDTDLGKEKSGSQSKLYHLPATWRQASQKSQPHLPLLPINGEHTCLTSKGRDKPTFKDTLAWGHQGPQSVELATPDLRVAGSSPMLGVEITSKKI